MEVNKVYGILTNRGVSNTDPFYLYTNVGRNKKQQSFLSELMPVNKEDIGAAAVCIIGILKTSEYWPDFIKEYDPHNTYTYSIPMSKEKAINNWNYNTLINWAEKTAINSNSYPVTDRDNALDTFKNKLLSILAIKEN